MVVEGGIPDLGRSPVRLPNRKGLVQPDALAPEKSQPEHERNQQNNQEPSYITLNHALSRKGGLMAGWAGFNDKLDLKDIGYSLIHSGYFDWMALK